MTNGQRLAAIGLFLVAVVAGVLVASFALGALGGSAESPSTAAVVSPSPVPSAPASSPPASASASPSPSVEPSPSPTESPSPSLTPTAPAGQPATFTITQLKLDAVENPDGQDRELQFRAGGAGPITARLTAISPHGQAVMCLKTASKDLGCTTTADGQVSAQQAGPATDYTLTLRGDGIAEPIVEVTLTFRSSQPEVTVANARFDGTEFPDTNGIQVIVTPRADGNLGLHAEWGGHPFVYEIDLIEQGGTGGGTLGNQGPATRVNTALPITAPNPWKLVVQNTETGFGPTGITASITWP